MQTVQFQIEITASENLPFDVHPAKIQISLRICAV